MNIAIRNLTKKFGDLIIFDAFNVTFEGEKIHCLFGPSGCGKTTLLNILAELESKSEGIIEGVNLEKCAYVFQEERLLPWRTVYENIAFVLKGKMTDVQMNVKVEEVLKLVQLESFKDHYPEALSGGMRQRVSLARAFAVGADLLLFDEPFKGLHMELKTVLMDYVIDYWLQYKPQLIFTTHDLDEAMHLASDIYYLDGPPLSIKKHQEIQEKHIVKKVNVSD